jgi:quercetin dioxygenase-like cupin family protein
MATTADGFITLPGQGSVLNMVEAGRSASFNLLSEHTGNRVVVFEEVMPAGCGTSLHLHHTSEEVMYVLSGEFTFKIGERVTSGGAGTCAFMPRGIAHAWKNSGADAGRALFIFTPVEGGQLFEELLRLQRSLQSMDPATFERLLPQYGWEIVGPSPF